MRACNSGNFAASHPPEIIINNNWSFAFSAARVPPRCERGKRTTSEIKLQLMGAAGINFFRCSISPCRFAICRDSNCSERDPHDETMRLKLTLACCIVTVASIVSLEIGWCNKKCNSSLWFSSIVELRCTFTFMARCPSSLQLKFCFCLFLEKFRVFLTWLESTIFVVKHSQLFGAAVISWEYSQSIYFSLAQSSGFSDFSRRNREKMGIGSKCVGGEKVMHFTPLGLEWPLDSYRSYIGLPFLIHGIDYNYFQGAPQGLSCMTTYLLCISIQP